MPVESASFHSETVQRLPMSLSKVSAWGWGVGGVARRRAGVVCARVGVPGHTARGHVGFRMAAIGARRQRGVSAAVRLLAVHRSAVGGSAGVGSRNSPSKNTLALPEASASESTSRLIMVADSTCYEILGRCAVAACEARHLEVLREVGGEARLGLRVRTQQEASEHYTEALEPSSGGTSNKTLPSPHSPDAGARPWTSTYPIAP